MRKKGRRGKKNTNTSELNILKKCGKRTANKRSRLTQGGENSGDPIIILDDSFTGESNVSNSGNASTPRRRVSKLKSRNCADLMVILDDKAIENEDTISVSELPSKNSKGIGSSNQPMNQPVNGIECINSEIAKDKPTPPKKRREGLRLPRLGESEKCEANMQESDSLLQHCQITDRRRGRRRKTNTNTSELNIFKKRGQKKKLIDSCTNEPSILSSKNVTPICCASTQQGGNGADPTFILDNSSDQSYVEATEIKDTTSASDIPPSVDLKDIVSLHESVNSTEFINLELPEELGKDKPSPKVQKRRERRCFPRLDENESEKTDSLFQQCQIYTSQVYKYRQNKFKLDSGLQKLGNIVSDEDSDSSSDPVVSTRVLRVKSPSKSPAKNRHVQIPATQAKLFSDLERLISQQEESQNLLDKFLTEDVPSFTSNSSPINQKKNFMIRVKWKTKLIACKLDSDEEFNRMLPEVVSHFGIPAENIKFFLNGELLDLFQTPADVNFIPGTFIECFASTNNTSGNNKAPSNDSAKTEDADSIEIKLQSMIHKQKLLLKCNKLQPLQKVLEEYAALNNLKPEQLTLNFDGEKVDPGDSPHDMGIENGDCLDVIIQ